MKNLAFSTLFLLVGVSVVQSLSLSDVSTGKDLLQVIDVNYRTAIRAVERGFEVVREYVKELDQRGCYKEMQDLLENTYAAAFNSNKRGSFLPPHMNHMWWMNQQKQKHKKQ